MKKQIYMFDMDGTLLDLAYDELIWNTVVPNELVKHHPMQPEKIKQKLHQQYTEYQNTLSWYSTTFWSNTLQIDILQLHRLHALHIQPRAGCYELLAELNRRGHECWIVTNADLANLNLKLENTLLRPYFKHIISSESIGYPKEHEQFWHHVMAKYPFSVKESVFIDDTYRVLNQAEQYGFQHVWMISQPSSQSEMKTQLPYPSINALTDLIPFISRLS
ncbi:HAD-IA family hydrolase [Acinetobacter apis]|uniref:Putative hydrolase of the HAD superfamily n=1 Tax=Acinetobacter apis TaxID=1229165 RepID=A0A217EDQ0_9GAMM|nr:HAD-IA family hydrolase [Acinetobacter apis]SNQ28524.1 putative hydrolase of the HAD superfamily [Acinetobacter apis]